MTAPLLAATWTQKASVLVIAFLIGATFWEALFVAPLRAELRRMRRQRDRYRADVDRLTRRRRVPARPLPRSERAS